jgi:hypothetical protein
MKLAGAVARILIFCKKSMQYYISGIMTLAYGTKRRDACLSAAVPRQDRR